MPDGVFRRLAHRLIGAGLPVPRPVIRLYESLATAMVSAEDVAGLPPPALRMRVAGSPEARVFTHGGELALETLNSAVPDLASFKTILDLGCGCGRVLRLLRDLPDSRRIGVDVDRECIQWCIANFPGDRFLVAVKDSQLSLKSSSVELCYAFSVLTHLDETLQKFWLAEVYRVLAPGGIFICSTHGEACRYRLSAKEAARFDADQIVVRLPNANTSNLCNSFHSPAAFRALVGPHFDVLEHVPEGAKGNAPQDLWVLRKR